MQDKDVSAWLALHASSFLSRNQLRQLILATGRPEAISSLSPDDCLRLGIPRETHQAIQQMDMLAMDAEAEQLQQLGVQLLPLSSPDYPELLRHIPDSPPLLYVRGNKNLLHQPQIAMVGSRRVSRSGSDSAYQFARELAGNGFTVTSGLALGVDAQSHRGALDVDGDTVAVLGTGIDVVYPARNRRLFEAIVDNGVIVSEFIPGIGPRRSLFPQRNRIISGLSLGVLVVEAAVKSGSLITARFALEQGREVFAIPGSIHNAGSKGCHALIRQGGTLVENTEDIFNELRGWLPPREYASAPIELAQADAELSDREQQLLALISFDLASVDWLAERSGWPMAELIALLTTLELKQQVENVAGHYQRLA